MGSYFYVELSKAERQELESRFLNWGKETLKALNEKQIEPKDVSPYIIQYYSTHLIRAHCGVQDFVALVSEGWKRAWFWVEGTYAGFLNEVKRVWQIAKQINKKSISAGKIAVYLGTELCCALCQASIFSIAGNIPPVLLLVLVEKEVWTPLQGLAYARQIPNFGARIEALTGLVSHLQEPHLSDVLTEVLAAAQMSDDGRIWDIEDRARVLVELALCLPESQRGEVLTEALVAAQMIKDERARARVLGELALHLPESQRGEVLTEALAAARMIKDSKYLGGGAWVRARVLGELALHLPESQRGEVLTEALAVAQKIEDERDRARVLGELALHLPEWQRGEVLTEALAAARMLDRVTLSSSDYTAWDRARVLGELARHLPESQRGEVLTEALVAAQMIEDERARVRVLGELPLHLPEWQRGEVVTEALAAARRIQDSKYLGGGAWVRARVLGELALHFPSRSAVRC